MNIIGRKQELHIFQSVLASKQSEFIAVYGRRRVGKTFLIHEFFSKQELYLACTGLKDGSLSEQIRNFMDGFTQAFHPDLPLGVSLTTPKTWQAAFALLSDAITKVSANKTIVIFLDELPWLARAKSGLLQNLDYFWNTKWSRLKNIKLIVCGSAAAWMINNLLNAKGGLHNRTTK